MEYLFWLSISVLLYTYIGYPLYVYLRASFSRRAVRKDLNYSPQVSVVFSAYNEGTFIERKINNLLGSAYPKEKIEILVGSDGSSDNTAQILSRLSDDRVKVFNFKERRGKVSVLNDLVTHATGEILVFCDVRQVFEPNTIAELAANFNDEKVGCVSGELIFVNSIDDTGISEGVGLYWQYEKFIRKCESAMHSMVGATGAVYAIRKKLYSAPPANTILDDLYIPLACVRRGFRSIWDTAARAYDEPAFTPREEYRRKVRTLSGNYQIFYLCKDLFIPFKSPVAAAFFSHKLLRVVAPFFMITLFLSNMFLARTYVYGPMFILQLLFYFAAALGIRISRGKNQSLLKKITSAAYMFCFMNFTALAGLYRFAFGKQDIAWEK